MKQSIILPAILALLATGAAGCSKSLSEAGIDPNAASKSAVEVSEGFSEEAVHQGSIIVKLKGDSFERIKLLDSDRSVAMSSLPTALQSTLASVGARSITPLYPDYPEHRARRHRYGLDRWMVIRFDDRNSVRSVLNKLSAFDEFEVVEPSYKTVIPSAGPAAPMTLREADLSAVNRDGEDPFDDPYLGNQWHYYNRGTASVSGGVPGADINLYEAWKKQTGRSDVIVCVVDGGVDYTHEDLAAHVDVDNSFNFIVNQETGKYKGEEGILPYPDDQGHATHVAGTISAVNNNGIGVAGVAGGDGSEGSGVTLINAQCYGIGNEVGSQEAAVVWGADHGAVISQNSWGYVKAANLKEIPGSIQAAIDYFIREAGKDDNGNQIPGSPMAGGVVIFAAGNESFEGLSFPAAYEPCVAVTSMNMNFTKAGYSNFGPWADLMAPGGGSGMTGVLSTLPESINPQKYGFMQGTSMATPHVSGVAALIVSEFGGEGYTAEECRAQLLRSLSPYDIYDYNDADGYAGKLGAGYVDAGAALLTNPGKGPEKPALTVSDTQYYQTNITFRAVANPNSGRDGDLAHHYNVYLSAEEGIAADGLMALEPALTQFGSNLPAGSEFAATLKGLEDGTKYSVLIVAFDTFGNGTPSDLVTFETPLNNSPEITGGLPEGAISLVSIMDHSFTMTAKDAEGHSWDYALTGDTKGVTVNRDGDKLLVRIQPVQPEEGDYTFTITLTDQYGEVRSYDLTYHLVKYFAPAFNTSFEQMIVGINGGNVLLDLSDKVDYIDVLPLTFTAASSNAKILEASIEEKSLVITPKAKGNATVTLTADDTVKKSTASVGVTVVNDADATVTLLYPMPATTKLNVVLNAKVLRAEVRVTSLKGELLVEEEGMPNDRHIMTIDISSLASGTYYLNVAADGLNSYRTAFIKY